MASPRSVMLPRLGASMPASIRSIVVLPEPDGPTIVRNSPSSTFSEMSFTAVKSPNLFCTSTSCSTGSGCLTALSIAELFIDAYPA